MTTVKKHLCVIGCGTFGSYLTKRLLQQFGDKIQLTVLEIGNENVKSEEEIGLLSESEYAKAPSTGRYFGLGGTSARWGGQILFFDERDNKANDPDWAHIVAVNEKHKLLVLDKLLGTKLPEKFTAEDSGNVKTGVWLKYFKRNIFNHLTKAERQQIDIVKDMRVTDFEFAEGKITAVNCRSTDGEERRIEADQFYLTTGAIESCRLLMEFSKKTGLLAGTDLGTNYGDHVSAEIFRVKGKPVLNGTDFTFTFHKGSFVTKRIVVHTSDGLTGYLHFTFNDEVQVFSAIKKLLFGQQKSVFDIGEIFKGIPFLVKTAWHYLVLKRLYVDPSWSFRVDMEQAVPTPHRIEILPEKKDAFDQSAVRVDWSVTDDDTAALGEIMQQAEQILKDSKLSYTPYFDAKVTTEKVEDIYHPVGFVRMGSDEQAPLDLDCRVRGTENLFHYSTAVFPSAKSINPTAAGFCLIEEHLEGLDG